MPSAFAVAVGCDELSFKKWFQHVNNNLMKADQRPNPK
jgi:hypothetical protein